MTSEQRSLRRSDDPVKMRDLDPNGFFPRVQISSKDGRRVSMPSHLSNTVGAPDFRQVHPARIHTAPWKDRSTR
jgi:hypothetical protein